MNRIRIVNNNIIPFIDDNVIICDNNITFSNSGNYYIDYVNSNILHPICNAINVKNTGKYIFLTEKYIYKLT